MGFQVKRFVDVVNQQFICGICKDVLKDPLMVKECQHFFCALCIRNQMKTSFPAYCPKDKSSLISYSKLIEPQKLIISLLNDLKIKCNFETNGCNEVLPLGQLDKHLRICEKNPLNMSSIKCFCGLQIFKKEMESHKQNCLSFIKNEIIINRSEISTFMAEIYSQCTLKTSSKRFHSEAEYLYQKLSQTLPQRSRDQNSIQNILLYLSWRLLDYKTSPEEDSRLQPCLRDLSRATYCNSDNIRIFCRLNGLDYITLIQSQTKNREIELSITDFLINFYHFEFHLKKLMERHILEMLLHLANPKISGVENSFNCVDILSQMIITFNNKWSEISSTKEKKDILNRIKAAINGWKLNVKIRKYTTLKTQIKNLKTFLNEMPNEVIYRYVWILVHHSRADPVKYVPMIEESKVTEVLKPLLDDNKIESYIKDFIQLLFHQINTFKNLGHLNGLENSDKKIIPNEVSN